MQDYLNISFEHHNSPELSYTAWKPRVPRKWQSLVHPLKWLAGNRGAGELGFGTQDVREKIVKI